MDEDMMDVLAEASLAAEAVPEEEAAGILQQLMCARREAAEAAVSEDEDLIGSADADGPDDLPRPWSKDEDDLLRRLALSKVHPSAAKQQRGRSAPPQLEMRAWREIAEHFDDRTPLHCAHRFQKVINPENIKGN